MEEFVRAAKEALSPCSYGSYGTATTSHLYGELLKKKAGIEMTHVPYRGRAPDERSAWWPNQRCISRSRHRGSSNSRRQDKGSRDWRREALASASGNSYARRIRFCRVRSPRGWIGVFVPAATPPKEIVSKLDGELWRIIKSPEGTEQIKRIGLVPVGDGAEAFVQLLRQDFERWKNIAAESGVRVD